MSTERFDKRVQIELKRDKIKVAMASQERKEVREKTTLGDGFIKKRSEKEEGS